jgi:hypothetical protein
MATLVRRLFKVALFIGLFLVSVRYVRPFNNEWTAGETHAWWRASDSLGVRDPEDLYIGVWLSIELIVTVFAYVVIMRLWRHSQRKKIRA